MTIREEWRQILGFDGRYEVSDAGRIRAYRTYPGGRVRVVLRKAPVNPRSGYPFVTLWRGSKVTGHHVHVLVCEAFHGPRPAGCVVNHINADKTDPRAENLEWVTRSENNLHAARVGAMASGSRKPNAKLTEESVRAARDDYASGVATIKALAFRHGVSFATMRGAIRGERNGWVSAGPPVPRDPWECRNGHRRRPGTLCRECVKAQRALFRQRRGLRVGHKTALTEAQVIEARARYATFTVTASSLADAMGVDKSAVIRAIRGDTWSSLPGAVPFGETCRKGHPRTPENTFIKNGKPSCAVCRRNGQDAWISRQKAARAAARGIQA